MNAREDRDFYRILNVDRRAHPEVIHAAYRTLLRILGKHPDLGGEPEEARRIIEAYTTLSDPARRHLYDRWLAAHSARTASGASRLGHGVMTWLAQTLPDYHTAPRAPVARAFDLVLERPSLLAPRLYVKAFSLLTWANRSTVDMLCRALSVVRPGMLPSIDVLLLVTRRAADLDGLLDQASAHAASFTWNRSATGVLTLDPLALDVTAGRVPRVLRRLRRSITQLVNTDDALRR